MDAINLKVDSPLVPRFTDEQAKPPAPGNGAGNGSAQTNEPQQAAPETGTAEPKGEAPELEMPQAEETPSEPPPEPWVTRLEDGRLKLRLRKPVDAHGEKVKYLTFKEPTGGDIERIGNPVSMAGGTLNFDAPIMTQMMSHLAQVPTSAIRGLHSNDWTNAAYAIWNFFVPDSFR